MTNESRNKLIALLGDLPDSRSRIEVDQVGERDFNRAYTLELLVLHLNGIEPVPAYFCRSKSASDKAPAVIYHHAHGGNHVIGKDEAIEHRDVLQTPPYAEALAVLGFHTLAIDHWNFGERRGRTESSVFKEMLWKGKVLWGMMVYDSIRATDYLVTRNDVDETRIAALGLSMGSTMAWWHAALDERIKVCVDICCLTDFEELIRTNGLDFHGIYYYVPRLLKEGFDTSAINALIAPRAHLATAGLYDSLTPVKGLDKVEANLNQVYTDFGAPDNWKLNRYPCGHMETAQMRRDILDWLIQKL